MPDLDTAVRPKPWDRLLENQEEYLDSPESPDTPDSPEFLERNLNVGSQLLSSSRPHIIVEMVNGTATQNQVVQNDEPETPVTEDCESGDGPLPKFFQKHISWRLTENPKSRTLNVSNNWCQRIYRQSRYSSRRVRKRVVFKHGDCNVVQEHVRSRGMRYLQDIFTTLVDTQWRWMLLVFAMNFLLSWLAFACVWYVIMIVHGDLPTPAVLAGKDGAVNNATTPTQQPCVTNIASFTSCFLFSIETQHTIGYGSRAITEECPAAIIVMCVQNIAGLFIQSFMVGIVFAKLSRPKKRTQTLLFSKNAVICHRDGVLCLMFRVGDMRRSHIIEAHVKAQLIRKKITKEGEHLPFYQQELKVGGDGEEDRIFFIWPTTIVHKIDSSSPLYKLSATDLLTERFEIVVILEGVIESTGMTTQARSSYLPSEIMWGHRFEPLVRFRKNTGEYEVDYAKFDDTREVDTALCSAFELDEQNGGSSTPGDSPFIDHITPGMYLRSPSLASSVESLQSIEEHHVDVKQPHQLHQVPTNGGVYGNHLDVQIPTCFITTPDLRDID